jgi:hypothetical protein
VFCGPFDAGLTPVFVARKIPQNVVLPSRKPRNFRGFLQVQDSGRMCLQIEPDVLKSNENTGFCVEAASGFGGSTRWGSQVQVL